MGDEGSQRDLSCAKFPSQYRVRSQVKSRPKQPNPLVRGHVPASDHRIILPAGMDGQLALRWQGSVSFPLWIDACPPRAPTLRWPDEVPSGRMNRGYRCSSLCPRRHLAFFVSCLQGQVGPVTFLSKPERAMKPHPGAPTPLACGERVPMRTGWQVKSQWKRPRFEDV